MSKKVLEKKDFEFIQIKKNGANIREIMIFCGVSPDDLEQELEFHDGGDSFMFGSINGVGGYQLGTAEVPDKSYILKFDDKFTVMDEALFNNLFTLVDEKQSLENRFDVLAEAIDKIRDSGDLSSYSEDIARGALGLESFYD